MSRVFVRADSESLYEDSTPITATPFSMGCWFYTADDTASQTLMFVGDKDVTERYYAISAERRIKHPAVSAITEAARTQLFG